jgi:hypothetical protein
VASQALSVVEWRDGQQQSYSRFTVFDSRWGILEQMWWLLGEKEVSASSAMFQSGKGGVGC